MELEVKVQPGRISGTGYYYSIKLHTGVRERSLTTGEIRRLRTLRREIEKKAKRVLGRDFLGLEPGHPSSKTDTLLLYVKMGVSKAPGTRHSLRSLIGWIELCDV